MCAWAQSASLGNGWVNKDGLRLFWDTRAEPGAPRPTFSGYGSSGPDANGWIAKSMFDRTARVYFGYEVHIAKVSEGIRIQFRPLNVTPAMIQRWRIDDPGTWKTWTVQVPGPQVLKPGAVIAIELMTNPGTGQKIVDYLSVQEGEPLGFHNLNQGQRTFCFIGGEARDFRIEDAELQISSARVTVNSAQGSSEFKSEAVLSGPIVWFSIPGKGRYAMSVIPRPGFQQAGEIRGTILRFALGSETFTLNNARMILGGNPFHLYVRHDPAYRSETFLFGGPDLLLK